MKAIFEIEWVTTVGGERLQLVNSDVIIGSWWNADDSPDVVKAEFDDAFGAGENVYFNNPKSAKQWVESKFAVYCKANNVKILCECGKVNCECNKELC